MADASTPFGGHASPDLAQAIPILTAIARLTETTVDDRIIGVAGGLLSNPATGNIISQLLAFINGLFHRHAAAVAPAPGVVPVPVTAPAPVPAPVAPVAVAATDDIRQLLGKLYFVEVAARVAGGRGTIEDRARFQEIQGGANIHGDSWLHTDVDPVSDSGTKYETGDVRWATSNHWAPNGNPIWLYYEMDGQSTLDGHHSESVEPGSVEDDQGCTPTYKVHGPGKFRFGFRYTRHDGRVVDSGLIGQGNQPGGAPFNISAG